MDKFQGRCEEGIGTARDSECKSDLALSKALRRISYPLEYSPMPLDRCFAALTI